MPPAGLPGADPTRPAGGRGGDPPRAPPIRPPPRVDAAPFRDDRVQADHHAAAPACFQDDRGLRPHHSQRAAAHRRRRHPGFQRRFPGLRCLRARRRRRHRNDGIATASGWTASAPRAGGRNAVPRTPSLALFYFPSGRVGRALVPRCPPPTPLSRIIYVIRNAPSLVPRSVAPLRFPYYSTLYGIEKGSRRCVIPSSHCVLSRAAALRKRLAALHFFPHHRTTDTAPTQPPGRKRSAADRLPTSTPAGRFRRQPTIAAHTSTPAQPQTKRRRIPTPTITRRGRSANPPAQLHAHVDDKRRHPGHKSGSGQNCPQNRQKRHFRRRRRSPNATGGVLSDFFRGSGTGRPYHS